MNFIVHVNTFITNEQDQILLVREKKEAIYNKLNLPGGHLELNEPLVACAKREAREEMNIDIHILSVLGVYTGRGKDHYINFIFLGKIANGEPTANQNEINNVDWYSMEEILKMPENTILNPKKLKKAIAAYKSGRQWPLDVIQEEVYGI